LVAGTTGPVQAVPQRLIGVEGKAKIHKKPLA
jgi:hypothetical protein